jgi:hypothetical protein
MMMIMNNLDPQVAQFPEELITYGGNGQVFSNWAQVNYYSKNRSQFIVVFNKLICFYLVSFGLRCTI